MLYSDQLHLCVQIDVGYNSISQAASLELIAAMKGKSMVSIGMEMCNLGVEGAKAVAELASVTASLTRLDVRYNSLDEEGKAVLQKAVEGRSGFKLEL